MLRIFNTLSRKKERFAPIDPEHVRVYQCGPTVYGSPHIGNGRPAVVFDVLFRVLRALYPRVTFVRNWTDVDDKIIERARALGQPIDVFTEKTLATCQAELLALHTLPPTATPRATEHIGNMIAMVETLIDKDAAYVDKASGQVFFRVRSFAAYGKLSGKTLEGLEPGARVLVSECKNDPLDFVLWKPAKDDEPGWESPWGRGRPGWHIECSAMNLALLGPTFDIHVGGQDLMFPHHENEIAQSCVANGTDVMAKYWMHNGFVEVERQKMSKSLGNVIELGAALEEHPGEAVRWALLSTHYRSSFHWGDDVLARAMAALDTLYARLEGSVDDGRAVPQAVLEGLCNDLNTPWVLQWMGAETDVQNLWAAGRFLGFFNHDPRAWLQRFWKPCDRAEVEALVERRRLARLSKDYAASDAARKTLLADHEVVLEDRADGSVTWRRI